MTKLKLEISEENLSPDILIDNRYNDKDEEFKFIKEDLNPIDFTQNLKIDNLLNSDESFNLPIIKYINSKIIKFKNAYQELNLLDISLLKQQIQDNLVEIEKIKTENITLLEQINKELENMKIHLKNIDKQESFR